MLCRWFCYIIFRIEATSVAQIAAAIVALHLPRHWRATT